VWAWGHGLEKGGVAEEVTLAGDKNICLMKLYARENFCVNKINFKHGTWPWAEKRVGVFFFAGIGKQGLLS